LGIPYVDPDDVMNQLDPIKELYNMYSEEEDTPRIIELEDDGERGKWGFSCYKQNVKGSGSSPQLRCGGERQTILCVTLTYVKITSSGVNCALKNSRGGKSRSGKVIKKGI